jgi:hypothetical protein
MTIASFLTAVATIGAWWNSRASRLKILPSNQSLILAGEPGGARGRPAASGAALQRVTILTARRDTTVVVQADYFSRDEDAPIADAADTATPSGASRISSYLNPIELYARTQRGLKDTSKPALLDVLA